MNDSMGMRIGSAIEIFRYDPVWAREFEKVRTELESSVGESILSVEHVGSTSVPGLDAKPIIDILIGVEDFEQSLQLTPTLENLGFVYRPDDELPDRHYFPRTIEGLRRHHVSLAVPESRHFVNTVAFRDALRSSGVLMKAYASLKRELADEAREDRLKYLNGKTAFILKVLEDEGFETRGDYPIAFGAGGN